MGGQTTTGQQTTNQNQNQLSQTTPWGPGSSVLQGILGNLSNINPNLSQTELGALAQLNQLGGQGNQFAGGIGGAANNLLAGGGAMDQAGLINKAYQQYQQQLDPYLQASYLDPTQAPGMQKVLQTIQSDVGNQIGGQFAGAGRDPTGNAYGPQAIARGISQGEAAPLLNQYNQNVQNQLGAMGSLYGAGNTTGGILSGMQQNFNQNQLAGIGAAGQAWQAQQSGPMLQLQAEAQRRGIPLQTLAQQMGIALPATQAFGQSTGYGTGQSTTQMQSPLWQQLLGGGIGGLGILGGTGGFGSSGWLTKLLGGGK